jgi:hypothetical protein
MEPAVTQAPANKVLTDEEKEKITTYKDDLKEWFQQEAIVSQQVVSMIPDSLYLKIRGKHMVKEAWDLWCSALKHHQLCANSFLPSDLILFFFFL